MITAASRYELRDRQGDYIGTFVTGDRKWQIGDVFTTGDGRVLRVIGIAAVTQQSRERPVYTGCLMVDAVEGNSPLPWAAHDSRDEAADAAGAR